uniref:Uncharacterized protein n=1 Tax=Anguilla anguilla TaxID=7936 RepID=A0A0E9QTZ2_ANGAN
MSTTVFFSHSNFHWQHYIVTEDRDLVLSNWSSTQPNGDRM